MIINRFEEMKVWKEARIFVPEIYRATSQKYFSCDFGLKDQIQRAAVSIMNNIAEGFERDNSKEFIRFLSFSKGSSGEVRSLLYVAFDLKYISQVEFNNLYEKSISIITQLSNFIKYLKQRKPKLYSCDFAIL